jgi:hypothetical protein
MANDSLLTADEEAIFCHHCTQLGMFSRCASWTGSSALGGSSNKSELVRLDPVKKCYVGHISM